MNVSSSHSPNHHLSSAGEDSPWKKLYNAVPVDPFSTQTDTCTSTLLSVTLERKSIDDSWHFLVHNKVYPLLVGRVDHPTDRMLRLGDTIMKINHREPLTYEEGIAMICNAKLDMELSVERPASHLVHRSHSKAHKRSAVSDKAAHGTAETPSSLPESSRLLPSLSTTTNAVGNSSTNSTLENGIHSPAQKRSIAHVGNNSNNNSTDEERNVKRTRLDIPTPSSAQVSQATQSQLASTAATTTPSSLTNLLGGLVRPQRNAIHDRLSCPLRDEDGVADSFHTAIQGILTDNALFLPRLPSNANEKNPQKSLTSSSISPSTSSSSLQSSSFDAVAAALNCTALRRVDSIPQGDIPAQREREVVDDVHRRSNRDATRNHSQVEDEYRALLQDDLLLITRNFMASESAREEKIIQQYNQMLSESSGLRVALDDIETEMLEPDDTESPSLMTNGEVWLPFSGMQNQRDMHAILPTSNGVLPYDEQHGNIRHMEWDGRDVHSLTSNAMESGGGGGGANNPNHNSHYNTHGFFLQPPPITSPPSSILPDPIEADEPNASKKSKGRRKGKGQNNAAPPNPMEFFDNMRRQIYGSTAPDDPGVAAAREAFEAGMSAVMSKFGSRTRN